MHFVRGDFLSPGPQVREGWERDSYRYLRKDDEASALQLVCAALPAR